MICQAVTKNAPHAHPPRVAHSCKNAAWADGWCKLHHPTLRLGRLNQKRASLVKSLQRVDDEIAEVKNTGAEATDLPGQLRMFDHQERATA